jgi:ligand-binding sensor domain-containing protein
VSVRLALGLSVLLLALPASAAAGGSHVDLVAGGRSVYVVGDAGLHQVDASTGRIVWAPIATEPRYDLSVAVADGGLWVASIANGDVDGRLTRVDLRSRAQRVVLRVPQGSVLAVAAGGGGVCALVGRASGNLLVRFAAGGAQLGEWDVGTGGRLTADRSGCWVSADGRLLHLDPAGRLRTIRGIPFGDVVAGAGTVWVGLRDALVRVDEHTGRSRTIRTGRLDLGGFQHDMAVAGGSLWVLGTGALQRRDARNGHLLAGVLIPRIADSVAVTGFGIWIGTTQGLRRLNPRTLRTTLRVSLL